MSFTVHVAEVSKSRLTRLRRELGELASKETLRSVTAAGYRADVERSLEEHSPVGGHPSDTKLWQEAAGERESILFATGWRVRRQNSDTQISWIIDHLLLRSTEEHRAKFLSVEFGSRFSRWTLPYTVKFKDGGWFSLEKGKSHVHKGNKGAHAIEKTRAYLEEVMMPQLQERVNTTIKNRLAKV